MTDDKFSNENYRPPATDDRPRYRFEDYEDYDAAQPPATAYQTNYAPTRGATDQERLKDEKHLDQLSLGFKIYAAVNALFSSFPIIHLVLGIAMVSGAMGGGRDAPPAFMGWFFIIVAAAFILFGYAVSICSFYAGRFIKERRNYTFCFVMSCISCMFMPLGTVLGIFSLIVLSRDPVKDIFKKNAEENPLG
ncbi:MAG TPA: hypothetical protein VIL74_23615 [Pyrinomonadaceae bacterium]|jgi:hypothetical protein